MVTLVYYNDDFGNYLKEKLDSHHVKYKLDENNICYGKSCILIGSKPLTGFDLQVYLSSLD